MATRIAIDVDLTLINEDGELLSGAVNGLRALKTKGYLLTLWSYAGEDYARSVARKHGLCCFFDEHATKPDLAIDDDAEALGQLPVIDPCGTKSNSRDWSHSTRFAIQLAESLDNKSSWKDVPSWIKAMSEGKKNNNNVGVQSAMAIWNQRDTYIRWPKHGRLLWEDVVRRPEPYEYPPELEAEILQAGLSPDPRTNGPAILAFQLAGGDRPRRLYPSSWGWTIHHIYDGKHPHPDKRPVPHAIKSGTLFTEAAGLVAVHPLADYVAMSVPLLAWLLRWEAFRRF
jgi:hypothetical protein